jgi:hypothetical protein
MLARQQSPGLYFAGWLGPSRQTHILASSIVTSYEQEGEDTKINGASDGFFMAV